MNWHSQPRVNKNQPKLVFALLLLSYITPLGGGGKLDVRLVRLPADAHQPAMDFQMGRKSSWLNTPANSKVKIGRLPNRNDVIPIFYNVAQQSRIDNASYFLGENKAMKFSSPVPKWISILPLSKRSYKADCVRLTHFVT